MSSQNGNVPNNTLDRESWYAEGEKDCWLELTSGNCMKKFITLSLNEILKFGKSRLFKIRILKPHTVGYHGKILKTKSFNFFLKKRQNKNLIKKHKDIFSLYVLFSLKMPFCNLRC